MIFLPELAEKIVRGEKTETRRIVQSGEYLVGCLREDYVYRPGGAVKWAAYPSKSYAVQPGRGKKAIARITITAIRRERLWKITPNGIAAEGFGSFSIDSLPMASRWFMDLWDRLHDKGERWSDNPKVWVLSFKVAPNG